MDINSKYEAVLQDIDSHCRNILFETSMINKQLTHADKAKAALFNTFKEVSFIFIRISV